MERGNIPVITGLKTPLLVEHTFPKAWRARSNNFYKLKLPETKLKPCEFDVLLSTIVNMGELPTIIALGPLTNIATAINQQPEIIDDLNRLVIMGGVIFPEKIPLGYPLVTTEFNASKDPSAVKIVFSQELDTTLVGLDVTTQVKFKDIHYVALKQANTPITRYLKKHVKSWLIFNKLLMGGFHPHDPIAIAYLLNKSLFKTVKLGLDIEVKLKKYSKIDKIYKMQLTDIFNKKGRIRIINKPDFLSLPNH